jgi:hypothetical protein
MREKSQYHLTHPLGNAINIKFCAHGARTKQQEQQRRTEKCRVLFETTVNTLQNNIYLNLNIEVCYYSRLVRIISVLLR